MSFLFLAHCHTLQAQSLRAELMGGPHKSNFETYLMQPLGEHGTFTFTQLAFFQRYHRAQDQPFDELGVQGSLYWNLSPAVGIGPGIYYNSPKGLMPRITMQLFTKRGGLAMVLNPAFYYHEDGFTGGELYGTIRYARPVNDHWSLAGRINGLTTWDRFADHGRSFLQLRVGPQFSRGTTVGLAFDADWYGPAKIFHSNPGIFITGMF